MPKIGELLDGRYKLTQELGAGGFGDTFLAEDQRRFQAQVVVKHFAPKERLNLEQFREFTQRFAEEAKALDRLGKSGHVPRLFDFFNQDQDYYLIQEYIEGHDLSREIGGEPRSEDYTRQFLKDICEILVFIHDEGVIHRDLKPANIMRHKDGRLVLIDFGSVKEVTARVRKNPLQQPTTRALGTALFAPPEQIVGKPCFESDIYAISMTAIVALLGDFPRQIGGKPTTEWDLSPLKVTPEFKAILRKMVLLAYDERYAGAEDVLESV